MTIRRDGADQFVFTTCGLALSATDTLARLRASPAYSEEQAAQVLALDVGDETKPPLSFYRINGVAHASDKGIVGKPLSDGVKKRYDIK